MMLIHCIIFSISIDIQQIKDYISKLDSNFPLMCLTPHSLFKYEQQQIKEFFDGDLIFKSFADFISDEEAERCDLEAYNQCSKVSQPNLGEFLSIIKERKNRIIADNVQKKFTFYSGSVFSNDLGIDIYVWVEKGFIDNFKVESSQVIPLSHQYTIISLISRLKRLYKKNSLIFDSFKILRYREKTYLFCGNISRVQQYFKKEVNIERLQIPLSSRVIRMVPRLKKQADQTILKNTINKEKISTILSSMHEHRQHYKVIAQKFGVEYGLLQDGYIPENYLPYYYLMECQGAKYYVWDSLSAELFIKNQLRVAISPLFDSRELPEITHLPESINTILILTSGAGDWTAVKNRSDDDLMLMAFVEVARKFANINFIYRCHPLWVHPSHQGRNSIERAIAFIKSTGLNNIQISKGSIANSKRYSKDGQLFVDPRSTLDEIALADLVFGEHSFSMIDVSLRRKLFASVLIANRRDYFINYTKLGFFHLNSKESIIQFITNAENNPAILCDEYNEAVRKHNTIINNVK